MFDTLDTNAEFDQMNSQLDIVEGH